jgi:hypothetical protein
MRIPIHRLFYGIYQSFTNVYGFYVAYVHELVFDDELDLLETGDNIDSCLLNLAASKLDIEDVQGLATRFQEFRYRIKQDYEK